MLSGVTGKCRRRNINHPQQAFFKLRNSIRKEPKWFKHCGDHLYGSLMLGNVQGTLFHFFASTPLYFKGEVVALPPASCSRALMCLQRPGRCAGVIVTAVKFSVASISRCCSKLIWYLGAKEKERQHFGFCWSKSLHWCCSRCSTAIAKWSFLLLWGDLRHHWRFGRDLSCAPCVFMGPPCEDRVALIPLWGFGRPPKLIPCPTGVQDCSHLTRG